MVYQPFVTSHGSDSEDTQNDDFIQLQPEPQNNYQNSSIIPSVEDELLSPTPLSHSINITKTRSFERIKTGSLTYDTKKFNDINDELDSVKSPQIMRHNPLGS